jgi:hypothetical protein
MGRVPIFWALCKKVRDRVEVACDGGGLKKNRGGGLSSLLRG